MVVVCNHKKNGDYYKNLCLSHLMGELWLQAKWWQKKLLLTNQSTNIVCLSEGNMVAVPNPKKNGDYDENASLSHLMDELWLQQKWWREKLFLPNQSITTMCSNRENMVVVPNHKKTGDYYKIPSFFHLMDKLWLQGKWWKENLF